VAKPVSIKVFCLLCEKLTEVIILKHFNKDEYKEELDWLANNKDDMVAPDMTKIFYDSFHNQLQKEETIDYVIGKIKSHKPTMFGKPCIVSSREYKILFYFIMDHKEQLGGFTFRIGEEIKYSATMLNFAEQYGIQCTTLSKESVSIVLNLLTSKKCTFTGDLAMNMYMSPQFKRPLQCIAADSNMNPTELREFIGILRDRLEDNGENVRAVIVNNSLFKIECFKNDQWYECVVVAAKGYRVNQ
jgi:hypothetical protein